MTLRNPDREAIAHGHITNEPIRQQPGTPSWVLKLIMAVTGFSLRFSSSAMAGNLKLYMPAHNGEPALDEYGEFLRSMGEPLLPHGSALWIIRIVLIVAILAHISTVPLPWLPAPRHPAASSSAPT
ncbi:hypothetical protein CACC_01480 [Corynebacterium accolens]|nr:hypothetical protein CACC_01480 [Corynebacterium accolens]